MERRAKIRMVPKLYDFALSTAVHNLCICRSELNSLPDALLYDVYYKYAQIMKPDLLYEEITIELFHRLLGVKHRQKDLLFCIQQIVNVNEEITETIALSYLNILDNTDRGDYNRLMHVIDLGINIVFDDGPCLNAFETLNGSVNVDVLFSKNCDFDVNISSSQKCTSTYEQSNFLNEGAWFGEAESVLFKCENLCSSLDENVENLKKLLECSYRLFQTKTLYCKFMDADMMYKNLQQLVLKLESLGVCKFKDTALYASYCRYHYLKNDYNEAYRWGKKAILSIEDNSSSSAVIIDALRFTTKVFVVRREFIKAKILIHKALSMAQYTFGHTHYKFAQVLADYGFYLLNSDDNKCATRMYKWALRIMESTFGTNKNLHLAIAREDLAYSLYVSEYNSGNFHIAFNYSNSAIGIMKKLLPEGHFILCSANRIKALILEEIILDDYGYNLSVQKQMLLNAEKLHKEALMVSMSHFGCNNLLNAKHYGNLGRLYQTMHRYEESEKMHFKAIAIKNRILGMDDYDVGLSIGHLASLYNYHMCEYKKAERLYLLSIKISLKSFGKSFSGLEYDYKGLIHVYEKLEDFAQKRIYSEKLEDWYLKRKENLVRESTIGVCGFTVYPLSAIKEIYDNETNHH